MLSKNLLFSLALTSAVSASPALRSRQTDPCQDTYNSCIAAGTAQVACSCDLTVCLGEDNMRNRAYCSSATANLPTSTSKAAQTTYACNPAHSYPAGATCTEVSGSLTLITPSPTAAASTSAYQCNPAHSYPGGVTCDGSARTLIYPSTSSMEASTTAAAPLASGTNAAAAGSDPKKVDGKTWTLNNLSRYCVDGNTGCDYNFDIVADGNTEHCTVVRMPGSDAATESWSNQPCGDYSVSWGYVAEPAPAYAVLTVVDTTDGELAWFGASDINGEAVTGSNPFGSKVFGTVGPEQVYTYN